MASFSGILYRHCRRLSIHLGSAKAISGVSACTALSLSPAAALTLCEGKGSDNDGDWFSKIQKLGDELASSAGGKLQTAFDSGVPTQVSYGFVCGYCSGYAAKKAGKLAAAVFGKVIYINRDARTFSPWIFSMDLPRCPVLTFFQCMHLKQKKGLGFMALQSLR